ncbi:hypothetical protein [Methylibium sp.]|uniref:hypothetical protein n=1 Tax=Methylibium sp. TaxID=2067992 RepID=UPI003D10349E
MNIKMKIVLPSLYVAATAIALITGLANSNDTKGSFVIIQLPIAIQLALLDAAGLIESLDGLPWQTTYFLMALASVVLLYAIGAAVDKLFHRN